MNSDTQNPAPSTGDGEPDGLDGAEEIAQFLSRILGPRWTPRRVYEVAERGGLPIIKIRGAGLIARKSALLAHIVAAEKAATAARE
jgi:hypothetical protein